jgi:hypothetical protein
MRRARAALSALAAVTVLVAGTSLAADWKVLEPARYASKARIEIDSKKITYYRFDAGNPLVFSIEGPTRVKVLTRLRLPTGVDAADYAISVLRDGTRGVHEQFTTKPSTQAVYVRSEDHHPGVIRRVYIDVPTGQHGYELRAMGDAVVDAKVFESAASTPSRASLAPLSYASVETFLHRDKELTYYVATAQKPVVFEVIGPTTVKVNTRLVFNQMMFGAQTYVVGVREVGEAEILYKLKGVPSETVVFRDRQDLIPGALRYFMLDVEPGKHTYEFRLADAVSPELAVKFYVPRGDLLNEP